MRKGCSVISSWLFLLVMFLTVVRGVGAAYFTLSPASGNYTAGDTFSVTLGINSGEEKVYAADVWISFDSSVLNVETVAAVSGSAFPFVLGDQNIDNSAGVVKIALNPAISSSLDAQPANGDLLSLGLSAKAGGTGTLSFICTDGSINDANIIEPETVSDIIVCSSNQAGSFVVGSGGSSDPDPTFVPNPTSVPDELDTKGEELPQTGVLMPVLLLMFLGLFGVGGAVFLYRL